jgi:hypothetical protein
MTESINIGIETKETLNELRNILDYDSFDEVILYLCSKYLLKQKEELKE